ncbi:hypothetical protein [Vibrio phage phiKT1024]|nr:hypothetical protein [Vibrio phage phiKT1024]
MKYLIVQDGILPRIFSERFNKHFFNDLELWQVTKIYKLYDLENGVIESYIVDTSNALILSGSELESYKKEHPELFI